MRLGKMKRVPKRVLLAVGAGLAVFAGTLAFAATLGGLTNGQVGASNAAVAACDTNGITSSFSAPAWDTVDKRYEVSSVTVSDVADTCDGASLRVTVADGANVQIAEGTLTIPTSVATSHTVTLTPAAPATTVDNMFVVIGS